MAKAERAEASYCEMIQISMMKAYRKTKKLSAVTVVFRHEGGGALGSGSGFLLALKKSITWSLTSSPTFEVSDGLVGSAFALSRLRLNGQNDMVLA